MSETKSIFIYFYVSSPDAAAWMLKFVFVYLANTDVLCYSLTIICCCQVQDYIYWIISTENDDRHHHKFIKYEKRLRKEGKNMLGLPIKQIICHFSASLDAYHFLGFVRTVQLIPYIYPAFVPFVRYFTSIHLSLWIRQIRVITKLPNSEQSYKGKVKTHNYINRQNQSTTGKLWKP